MKKCSGSWDLNLTILHNASGRDQKRFQAFDSLRGSERLQEGNGENPGLTESMAP